MRLIRVAAAALILTAMAAGPVAAGFPVGNSDVAITKVGAPKPIPAGTNLTYTMVVQNSGPDNAAGVLVTDPLPASETFVSLTVPAGWTTTTPAVGTNGTVLATIPTLTIAAGPQTLILVVHVDAATPPATIITNTAVATSVSADPTPGNNTAVDSTDVVAAPAPTPAASVPNAAMPESQTGSPIAILGLGALLLSALATSAWVNRRRYRSE
jgi:uncharacterized repeat protein (TIGR01451 family)